MESNTHSDAPAKEQITLTVYHTDYPSTTAATTFEVELIIDCTSITITTVDPIIDMQVPINSGAS